MEAIFTTAQQARYRDAFGLTQDEINRIAVGKPDRVHLQAGPSESACSVPTPRPAVFDRPLAVGATHRTID